MKATVIMNDAALCCREISSVGPQRGHFTSDTRAQDTHRRNLDIELATYSKFSVASQMCHVRKKTRTHPPSGDAIALSLATSVRLFAVAVYCHP